MSVKLYSNDGNRKQSPITVGTGISVEIDGKTRWCITTHKKRLVVKETGETAGGTSTTGMKIYLGSNGISIKSTKRKS